MTPARQAERPSSSPSIPMSIKDRGRRCQARRLHIHSECLTLIVIYSGVAISRGKIFLPFISLVSLGKTRGFCSQDAIKRHSEMGQNSVRLGSDLSQGYVFWLCFSGGLS